MRALLALLLLAASAGAAPETCAAEGSCAVDIATLEESKKAAIADENFELAAKIKKQIAALKEAEKKAAAERAKAKAAGGDNAKKIKELEAKKATAIANEDFEEAGRIKKAIAKLKAAGGDDGAAAKAAAEAAAAKVAAEIKALETKKKAAVEQENFEEAAKITKRIKELKSGGAPAAGGGGGGASGGDQAKSEDPKRKERIEKFQKEHMATLQKIADEEGVDAAKDFVELHGMSDIIKVTTPDDLSKNEDSERAMLLKMADTRGTEGVREYLQEQGLDAATVNEVMLSIGLEKEEDQQPAGDEWDF